MGVVVILAQGLPGVPGGGGLQELTIGLGIIAAALIVGQVMVYKFIFSPERQRSDKLLESERIRHDKLLAEEQSRGNLLLQEEKERSIRLEAELRDQNEVIQERAIPALISATNVTAEGLSLIRELHRERDLDRKQREWERKHGIVFPPTPGSQKPGGEGE